MAIVKCHECGKQISTEAAACPGCGAKPKRGPSSGLVIGITLFAMLLLLGFCGRQNSTPEPRDDKASAIGACRLFIERALHDPDSAKFETSDRAYASESGGIWTVTRDVRAKNVFGTLRKHTFTCSLKTEGDRWVSLGIRESE